jgi:hypothetical protein
MKRDTLQFALMASLTLFSSLAFAADKNKSASSSDEIQPAAAVAAGNTSANNNPCVSNGDKRASDKKSKNKAKPAPTDQEKEFDKVLMGIYG